ncbi:rifamycin-inactivating phosphotransferase [Patulibacter sp. SYSU D01012]|uniref:rifamycin-inactivating phosphotransferase n=1 Tax=Patulibacter sp. SYSU D01012 TaxID=2817381 RepID=UPI001B30B601|nr:rifamycin-inactivating phosphotransferase [Patulibacter sp. SYSU D01012]
MGRWTLDLEQVDGGRVADVGGKGARLGGLTRVAGVRVPAGFCVTTSAFRAALAAPAVAPLVDRLAQAAADDHAAIRARSARLRDAIEALAVPEDVAGEIRAALARHGREDDAWVVRSSAPAEDADDASFAGQHDSFLGVVGHDAVLRHVVRCWASLFNDRAVAYRLGRDADPTGTGMAVVVQRLVDADASGVLFTADPVSGNRHVACVEAVPGLGDALVSGRAAPDVVRVRDGRVLARTTGTRTAATRARPGGGTHDVPLPADAGDRPVLTDAQAVRLADLGRRIEAAAGAPQDVEWCLVGETPWIVQSRPITTLFPVPRADDDAPHVWVSVGHQQMMTHPMRPLGRSLHQRIALPRMHEAAGRLFVDIAPRLASPETRAATLHALGASDPLMGDVLRTIVDRGFLGPADDDAAADPPVGPARPSATTSAGDALPHVDPDPGLAAEQVARTEASLTTLERDIRGRTGTDLIDFVLEDVAELRRRLFDPGSTPLLLAAMDASAWLNAHLEAWLGERNVADVLTLSAPGNVTSEMGLALLDVADAVRPHPHVVAFLEHAEDDELPGGLDELEGGPAARAALEAFLDRYGMRCVGEIDVTRPRWRERPSTLVPLILSAVDAYAPGESARRFARGRQRAEAKAREVLARLRALPDGDAKAARANRAIRLLRTFIGYREHPKYGMVRRTFVYKQALLGEAARLVDAGVLRDVEDVFFLTLDELRDVVSTGRADDALIAERRRAFRAHEALTPPRVITSEGEVVAGSYGRDDVPAGALVGLAVSGGTVEGRARVVDDLADADLAPGDVLVTTYTDPAWSPLFVTAGALVTEVGGLMTHGAVVAREYGLPAVVGVDDATRRIRDGQRVRVHGRDGFVELLD